MSPTLRKTLFGLLFSFTLSVGSLLMFPMGIVSRVIEAQTEKALGYKYDVSLEKTTLSGLPAVSLHNLQLLPLGGTQEGPKLPIKVEKARISLGLFSLLRGKPAAEVTLTFPSGEIVSRLIPGDGYRAEVDFFDVDLRDLDIIRQKLGLPVSGAVRGNMTFELDAERRLQGGEINLSIAPLVIGPGALKAAATKSLEGGIPLPATALGTVSFRANIKESDIVIDALESDGKDIKLASNGKIQVREPFKASSVQLDLRFLIEEDYKERAGLGGLFGMMPVLQRASCGEGWYGLRVSGSVARLGPPSPLGANCKQGAKASGAKDDKPASRPVRAKSGAKDKAAEADPEADPAAEPEAK